MSDIKVVVVPRDLYYHEVAYVRGLEAELERLKAHVDELKARLQHYEDGAEAEQECREYGK